MQVLPKISIIIPIYNVEKYIIDCLQSVMHQTYVGEIECILVDDCGEDNSMSIVERTIVNYSGKIAFRILHHDQNRGLSAARNTGTNAATGDYIYYIDSDDYISDDCLEVLAEPLMQREYDMVIGDYEMFGNMHNSTLLLETKNELVGNNTIFESYADRRLYVMAWNKLCKLSYLRDNDITFLEGQLHEDELWTYKTMLCAQSIGICHKIVYFYRVRSNSIVTDLTNAAPKLASYFSTIQYIQKHKYEIENDYYKCLLYYWNLYLSIAFGNNLSFLKSYLRLRKSCPYNPLKQLLLGKISIKQFSNIHLAILPIAAYCYLRFRYGKK